MLLLKRALSKAGVSAPLTFVTSGSAAISYLKGEGVYADRNQYPLPQVMLLDIKLPELTGFEVLEWLRKQKEFRDLAVIMLTSSDQPRDVELAYALSANAYIVKRSTYADMIAMAEAFKAFWINFNQYTHR